jgi:hypothetical protein
MRARFLQRESSRRHGYRARGAAAPLAVRYGWNYRMQEKIDATRRRSEQTLAALTSRDLAAAFVEAVLLRVVDAVIELGETRGFGEHLAAIVGDATPHPLPGCVGFLNP